MHHATFPLDIKNLSDAGRIEGLAASYGNVDLHGEVFAKGAFAASIRSMQQGGRQPALLLHHDPRRPAGCWDELVETERGLVVKGSLALDATDGREAYALLKAGALKGLSVGFRSRRRTEGKPGTPATITEAELVEVSLVSTPSNPLTRIDQVKAATSAREIEELLRDAGMSGRRAKAAAAAAWRAAESINDTSGRHMRAASLLTTATRDIENLFRS